MLRLVPVVQSDAFPKWKRHFRSEPMGHCLPSPGDGTMMIAMGILSGAGGQFAATIELLLVRMSFSILLSSGRTSEAPPPWTHAEHEFSRKFV